MWVVKVMSRDAHAAKKRSMSTWLGCTKPGVPGAGKFTPRSPCSAAHSSSWIVASMSQNGSWARPTLRSGSTEQKSASHRLYSARPTAASSRSAGSGASFPRPFPSSGNG
jgi:hypothetical protein